MKKSVLEKLQGSFCKIVMKEPGENKAHIIRGKIKEIDHKSGHLLVESTQGLGCIKKSTIIAIKPLHPTNKNT